MFNNTLLLNGEVIGQSSNFFYFEDTPFKAPKAHIK